MKGVLRNVFKFSLFLSVGVTILYLVYRSNQKAYEAECIVSGIEDQNCSLISKILSDFGSVNLIWILVVLILFMISNILRSLRWDMMFRSLGYHCKKSNLFFTIMLGYFANLGIPRSGELIRAASLSRYENIPLDKVMGTIVLDRIMDVLCLLMVIVIGLALEGDRIISYLADNAIIPGQNILRIPSFWIFIVIAIGLATFIYMRKDRLLESKLAQQVLDKVKGFYAGVMSISKLDQPVIFVAHSLGIWLMYYLMTYLCFFAYAPTEHLGTVAGLTVFIFGTLGMVIPSPGGMGSYHYLVNQALLLYGIQAADGFSFANIIFFSISIFCNVILGIISLIALPIVNRAD